jgi:hypothetical protein
MKSNNKFIGQQVVFYEIFHLTIPNQQNNSVLAPDKRGSTGKRWGILI